MKIDTSSMETIYIDIKKVSSVNIQENTRYLEDRKTQKVFVVLVNGSNMNYPVYENISYELAKEVLIKIGESMENNSPEKTYLDGFKDGTEYALRLINTRETKNV